MFKLALKNITSKPLRFVATTLAVAVVVAMIFCMLSFKGAVYDYIYATETASSGISDITISTNSTSDRIMKDEPLQSIDGVEQIVPSLKLYAMYDDEYVGVRGFKKGQLESLATIEVIEGDISKMQSGERTDDIIVSKDAAKHFGFSVGDRVEFTLGTKSVICYIGAIAKQSGYFLDDAPYLMLGLTENFSSLIFSSENLCNEIHVVLQDKSKVEQTINEISAMPEYKDMLVTASKDAQYIEEQTQSLTAPVVLAGGAVLALGIAIIVLLFLMSEGEKVNLISKLKVVGATKRQITSLFLIESALQACIGTVIGSLLAAGVFIGLLKLTLSSSVTFGISVGYLFLAGGIGLVCSILSSLAPILRSFKGSIRENQLDVRKPSKASIALLITFALLTVVSVVIEFCVPSARAIMSVFGIAFSVATLSLACSKAMKIGGKLASKSSLPSVQIGAKNIVRDKRFSRSVTMLTVGMTIAMMLFMSYSLTTNIFTSYVDEFSDMVFVTNIQADVDEAKFEQIDGVKQATKMVWGKSDLRVNGIDKTMNMLGSKDVLDIVDFEYITSKSVVYERISSDKPYVFVDYALKELYGVSEGDALEMNVEGVTKEVVVGGILKHTLFSGNYVVVSADVVKNLYGKQVDTVLATVDGDMDKTVGLLREKYAGNNYYVIKTLDAFKWEMESMQSVFDLIGTLAAVVTIFIFAVTVASSLIGRATTQKSRTALLNAGMSKNALLGAEVFESAFVALVAFVLSFAFSVLITSCLIHALRLFGLYFEFMYEAWVVAAVGGAMSVGYTLIPLALCFKKGYNIKKV